MDASCATPLAPRRGKNIWARVIQVSIFLTASHTTAFAVEAAAGPQPCGNVSNAPTVREIGVFENSPETSGSAAILRLKRFLPSYEVTVFRDRSVVYVGTEFVHVKGLQRSKLSESQLQTIVRTTEQAALPSFSADYTSPYAADAGLVEITYWTDVGERTIRFQPAGPAPLQLRHLADLVDRTVNTKQWICPLPRFGEIFCK